MESISMPLLQQQITSLPSTSPTLTTPSASMTRMRTNQQSVLITSRSPRIKNTLSSQIILFRPVLSVLSTLHQTIRRCTLISMRMEAWTSIARSILGRNFPRREVVRSRTVSWYLISLILPSLSTTKWIWEVLVLSLEVEAGSWLLGMRLAG